LGGGDRDSPKKVALLTKQCPVGVGKNNQRSGGLQPTTSAHLKTRSGRGINSQATQLIWQPPTREGGGAL